MVFRMIPLLLQRWKEIGEVQKGTGYTKEISGMVEQVRFFLKKISILISWSLENSIDTSISMENRGYGTGKRTSFHLFRWNKQDGILLIFSIIHSAACEKDLSLSFEIGKHKRDSFIKLKIKPRRLHRRDSRRLTYAASDCAEEWSPRDIFQAEHALLRNREIHGR